MYSWSSLNHFQFVVFIINSHNCQDPVIYDDSAMHIITVSSDSVLNSNHMGVIFVTIFNDKYFISKLILVRSFFVFFTLRKKTPEQ